MFNGVSKVIQGWFRDVLRVYQGSSMVFQWWFRDVSRVFHGYFEGVSGMA